ncbi:MAG: Hypothetical protein AJITA_00845 [Acetilactobacillus jinshanensis]
MDIQKAKKILANENDTHGYYTTDEEIDDLYKLCNGHKNKNE